MDMFRVDGGCGTNDNYSDYFSTSHTHKSRYRASEMTEGHMTSEGRADRKRKEREVKGRLVGV